MISIYKSKNNIPFDRDKERVTFVEDIQKIESCKVVIKEFSSEPNKDFLSDMTQFTKDLKDAETSSTNTTTSSTLPESRVMKDSAYEKIKSTPTFVSRFGDDVIFKNSRFLSTAQGYYCERKIQEVHDEWIKHKTIISSETKKYLKSLVALRVRVDLKLDSFNFYFNRMVFVEMYNSELPSIKILTTATLKTLSNIADIERYKLVNLVGIRDKGGKLELPKNVPLISDQDPKIVFSFVIIVAFFEVTSEAKDNQGHKASIKNVKVHYLANAIIIELTKGCFCNDLGIKFHSESVRIFIDYFFTNLFFNMYSTAGFTLMHYRFKEGKAKWDSLYINFGFFLKNFLKELEPRVPRVSKYPRLTPPYPWEDNLMQPTDGKPSSRIIGGYLPNLGFPYVKGVIGVVRDHQHKLTIHFSEERQKDVLNSINWNQSVGKLYPIRLFDDFIIYYSLYASKGHQKWFDNHPCSLLKDLQEIEKGYDDSLFEDLAFYYYEREIKKYLLDPYKSHMTIPTKEGAVIHAKYKIQKFIAFYNIMCVVKGLNTLSGEINRAHENRINEVFPLFDVMRIDFRGRLYSEGNFNIIIQKQLRKNVILCESSTFTERDGVRHFEFLKENPEKRLSDVFLELVRGDTHTVPVSNPTSGAETKRESVSRVDMLQYADQEIVFILAQGVFGDKEVTSKANAFRLLAPLFFKFRNIEVSLKQEDLEFRYCIAPLKYSVDVPKDHKHRQTEESAKANRHFILQDLTGGSFHPKTMRTDILSIGSVIEQVLLSRKNDFNFSDPQKVTKIVQSFRKDKNFTIVLDASCSAVQIIAAAVGNLKFLEYTNLDFTDELFESPITSKKKDFYAGFGNLLKRRLNKTIAASSIVLKGMWSHGNRIELFLKLCSNRSFLKSVAQALLYSAGIDTVKGVIIDDYSLDSDTAYCFSRYIINTFNSYTKPIRGPLIKYYSICKEKFDIEDLDLNSVGDTKFFVEVPLGTIDMGYIKYKQSSAGFKAVFSDGTERRVRPECIPHRTDAEFDTTKFEKDFIQIKKAFLPNIIHSIDAFVMHQVVLRCKIEKVLVSTIHDAFVVNICDAAKLRIFYIEAIYDLNEAMCDIAKRRGLKGFKRLPKVSDRVTKAPGGSEPVRRSYLEKILDNNFHFLKP